MGGRAVAVATCVTMGLGCAVTPRDDASGLSASAGDGEGGTDSALGESGVPDDGATDDGSDESSDGDGVKLDVGAPDGGGGTDPGGAIPTTCEEAATASTTIGCEFFGVDLDQGDWEETAQFSIVVANVQVDQVATVDVEVGDGAGGWAVLAADVLVDPLQLSIVDLPNNRIEGSGRDATGSYRVTSDVPIIAYQFNPLQDVKAHSSDASLLYPTSAWDTEYRVQGWRSGTAFTGSNGQAYVALIAASDGTELSITPSIPTRAGGGVPAGTPGEAFSVTLGAGEVVKVEADANGEQLTGTTVVSTSGHAFAVLSGHECGNIPFDVPACDHMEDQLAGVHQWGTHFVAARMPVRAEAPVAPDPTLWQVVAHTDDTVIEVHAPAGVTGLPESVTLHAGESVEWLVAGTHEAPGDFVLESSEPIAVVAYMTGAGVISSPGEYPGDPAMVQVPPVEQFVPRTVVLVPQTWERDVIALTREAGAAISIDGAVVDDAAFTEVAVGWEVARVDVADGVHVLEGEAPFSAIVVSYDRYDSCAYLGGTATVEINPAG